MQASCLSRHDAGGPNGTHVRCEGKGRNEHAVPLTGQARSFLRAWAACARTLAGKSVAGSARRRKRSVFCNSLYYAVEQGHLGSCGARKCGSG